MPSRCFVGTLGLSTGFFYLQFVVEIPVYPAIKLWPIVGYNRLRYSEPAHDALPYELNLFIFYGCEGFSFYPFTKIVDGN